MWMDKKYRRPKCYCLSELLDDGTCRWKCPAEARPRLLRAQASKRRLNSERPTRITITGAEKKRMSDALAKLDPTYNRQRKILIGAALKSHSAGARR